MSKSISPDNSAHANASEVSAPKECIRDLVAESHYAPGNYGYFSAESRTFANAIAAEFYADKVATILALRFSDVTLTPVKASVEGVGTFLGIELHYRSVAPGGREASFRAAIFPDREELNTVNIGSPGNPMPSGYSGIYQRGPAATDEALRMFMMVSPLRLVA